MKLLGLNSPELFIILVILFSILGPKRIEKGLLLFNKLLKFLLSKDEAQTIANSKVKSEEPEKSEVKEEIVEPELKSEEAEESKVKEETIDPEVKSIKPSSLKKVSRSFRSFISTNSPQLSNILLWVKFHKLSKYSSSSGNATNFKYVLFKAYSLAKSESNPSLFASQKTLANLLPTEV